MTAAITLTPGRATLADWGAVADGAAVRLDPAAELDRVGEALSIGESLRAGGPHVAADDDAVPEPRRDGEDRDTVAGRERNRRSGIGHKGL